MCCNAKARIQGEKCILLDQDVHVCETWYVKKMILLSWNEAMAPRCKFILGHIVKQQLIIKENNIKTR